MFQKLQCPLIYIKPPPIMSICFLFCLAMVESHMNNHLINFYLRYLALAQFFIRFPQSLTSLNADVLKEYPL